MPSRFVRARISDEAHAALDALCRDEGITVAGFLEALGLWLADGGELTEGGHDIIRRARDVDSERRSRRTEQ